LGFSEDDLRPAPDIGADSRGVLLEAGFESDAIENLISTGVVRASAR
jgi:crotonobetainyl-CoA:carnitine CoA-transferase CaiB-like acyl-CoA transferase